MTAKGWMIWQCVYAALFVACAVQACVSFAEGTAVFWAMIPAMAYSGCGLSFCNYLEQLEKQHGTDRRANTEVHSDPDDGAFSITWEESADGTTTVTESGTLPAYLGTVSWTWERRSEPRTVERTGIRLGEVEGYRAWRLAGPVLTSFCGVPWLPGQPCEGLGLNENNRAGVHAFKALEDALDYASDDPPAVVGKVKLWGEIVEHTDGYRGEFAKPTELVSLSLFLNGTGVGDAGPSDDQVSRIVLAEVSRLYGLPNGPAA